MSRGRVRQGVGPGLLHVDVPRCGDASRRKLRWHGGDNGDVGQIGRRGKKRSGQLGGAGRRGARGQVEESDEARGPQARLQQWDAACAF